jgi:hypothetical protein
LQNLYEKFTEIYEKEIKEFASTFKVVELS